MLGKFSRLLPICFLDREMKEKRPPAKMLKASIFVVPEGGLEPPRALGPEDFESSASTNSTTPA